MNLTDGSNNKIVEDKIRYYFVVPKVGFARGKETE